jgi:nitrous oxidase accessory protein
MLAGDLVRKIALPAAVVAFCAVAAPAGAATLCVGEQGGCFTDLQQAVDAARDGDAIRVGPGSYRGGVTIDASVELRGAGAAATRIGGAGPVLTIGAPSAPDPPTVAISGVTITGGVTTSSPGNGHEAFGGGVLIPRSQGEAPGATVTIADSVIEGNLAAPARP